MMPKAVLKLIFAVAISLTLCGCGGSGGASTGTESTSVVTPIDSAPVLVLTAN